MEQKLEKENLLCGGVTYEEKAGEEKRISGGRENLWEELTTR
jgi:hypothetical protein